jgi:hypothetical protein
MRRPLLVLLSLLLIGCSQASRQPVPAPLDWYLGHGMEPLPVGSCPFPNLEGTPVLAGVQPFGLEGRHSWRPGVAEKVNWVPIEAADRMELTLTAIDKAPRMQFILSLPAEPSVIQFPGPGCWELNVKVGQKEAQIRLPIRPDRPAYVGALSDEPRPPVGLAETNKHLAQLLRLIAEGKEAAKPMQAQPSWWLTLVWEHTGETPLRFFESGVLEVPKSLVTGDCRDAEQTLFRMLPPDLTKRITQDLTSLVRVSGEQNRLPFSGNCSTFRNRADFA